ncbi:BTAD domain-containing putative transcriptional regulator [Pseudonocardia sp. MH-G8]|uniref:AfsR/SARP family transcriptional regulator n=1 Tax=Pseudonocardia sp. MH-G8 TaxID=1854588 RepID=UPI00130470E4|nr:BTAD domain-containing putative transcriptional regulator [Pseudonocardia sp. MH-G8]
MRAELGVLGETTGRVGGREIDLGPARQRAVLAVLLVDAGHAVPLGELVTRVWGDRPPLRAAGTLRSYLSRLRAAMALMGEGGIRRGPGGYLVEIDEAAVDLHRFRDLSARARASGGAASVELYREALALWRGDALAELDTPWAVDVRQRLAAERFAVRLDWHDARLRRGRHAELVAELAALAVAHPLDERVVGQCITALCRSGRQADAFTMYDRIRRRLADEMGADPGPALQQLYQLMLDGEAGAPVDPAADRIDHAPVERETPRQLPSDVPGFVGRAGEIERLDRLLDHAGPDRQPDSAPVVISAVHGTAGIGKTALAVHWAQHAKQHFPDGQLYLNLRGCGPDDPVSAADALETLLRTLGVAPDRVPPGVDERSALLRSRLAARRMLILLDNAGDSDQVRPLLPGNGGLVLVTSRRRLHALSVREGARHIALDLLTVPEALQLLGEAIGQDRVDREPAHAEAVVTACARLPLALRLAAERINRFPDASLAEVVAELTDHRRRLGALTIQDSDDTDLRSVFAWSYTTLEPDAARMFALLGLYPGNGISVSAAAALAGVDPAQARDVLDRLTTVSLLEQRFPERYELHDLLRDFAREQHRADADAAHSRLVAWYVHTAASARAHLSGTPHRMPVTATPPEGVVPMRFTSLQDAVAWFDRERTAIVEVVTTAAAHGHPESGAVLSQLSWNYFYMRGYPQSMIELGEAAVQLAVTTGNAFLEAKCRNGLGVAYGRVEGFEQEIASCQRAFTIFGELGELTEQATALLNTGSAYNRLERFDEGRAILEHAQQLYTRDHNSLYAAFALNNLAESYLGLGRFDEALDRAHRALEALQDGAEQFRLVAVFETIAHIHAMRGDHHSAVQDYRNALDVAHRTETTYLEVSIRAELGKQLMAIGEHDQAIAVWRAATRIPSAGGRDPAVDEIEALLASATVDRAEASGPPHPR